VAVLSRRTLLGVALSGAIGMAAVAAAADEAVAGIRDRPLGYTTLPTSRPAVALTFDDGPDPRFTAPILDLLRERGATATFFVVGVGVAAHPDLVRRMAAEGHEVANHTLSHERLDRLDRDGVRAQLEGGAAAIDALSLGEAARCRLVRPPFGFEGPAARAELVAGGWEVARWRGCLERHLADLQPDAAARRLAAGARSGHVLLAHDGGIDRSTTVAALPVLLDGLAARGLAVGSIGGLGGGRADLRPQ
jgi:peptidoglycan/xylan/chitin deacetylase (PgdA/CDA1 family)